MGNKYIQEYQTMNGAISASPKIWYLYIYIFWYTYPRKKLEKFQRFLQQSKLSLYLSYNGDRGPTTYLLGNPRWSSATDCPFGKRSLPFLKHLEMFWPVRECFCYSQGRSSLHPKILLMNLSIIWKINRLVVPVTSVKFKSAFLHL